MKVLCALGIAVAVSLGCTATRTPAVETPAEATPTDVPASSPETSASVVPTPGPDAWGPLAVIPPQDGADTGRAEGTLRIMDGCVYLESRGGHQLLFWPADRTAWSEESKAITFSNFDGSVVTVGDGDSVILGGGGDSEAESGLSGQAWAAGISWVAPPAASCALDPRWGVGGVYQ